MRKALKDHWLSCGVEIEQGVTESELNAFERRYNVHLPEDFRDYLMAVNGMSPHVYDDDFIRFWMLNEIKPVSEGAPEYAGSDYIDIADSVFLFADFSIWAHAFGIRGSREKETHSNTVYVIGGLPAIPIASSFSEFVNIYLTDTERLVCGF